MKQIPINEENIPTYNKKAIRTIIILVICGIVTGILLSSLFAIEANDKFENPEMHLNDFPKPNNNKPYPNTTSTSPFRDTDPLTTSELILPTAGVIIACISSFLLVGLIVIYFKIFLNSNSKYIVGLLFFLIPLLIQSIFLINTLRHLFVSDRITFFYETLGFGFGGLGGIIIMVSIFESIGLTFLLYLSSE